MKNLLFFTLILSFLEITPLKADDFKYRHGVDFYYIEGYRGSEESQTLFVSFMNGFVRGYIEGHKNSKNKECLSRLSAKNVGDRFEALYLRQFFEVDEFIDFALVKTINTLCPE